MRRALITGRKRQPFHENVHYIPYYGKKRSGRYAG
jgi:hypothetical protein